MTRSELIAFLEEALTQANARVGPYSFDDKTWHRRARDEVHAIAEQLKAEHGARIRVEWDGARVSMAGVSSTATSGLSAALRNWIAAARRKEEAS